MRHLLASSTAGASPSGDTPPQPLISIVVPVRNEERDLGSTLDALLTQQYPQSRFEILVVDGDSQDGTPALVAGYAERSASIRPLRNPRRGVAAGRNIGFRAARGELIVIVDGHSIVDGPRWLSKLASAFAETGADCVGYPQVLAVNGSSMQRAVALARASAVGRHPDSFNYTAGSGFVPAYGAAVAYRRAVFDVVGGFDESFDAAEDMELNYRVDRAGLRCFFTSAISARYQPRATSAALFRQQWRYGRGRVRLWRKHRGTFALTTFFPAILMSALAAGLYMLPKGRAYAVLAASYPVAMAVVAALTAFRAAAPRLFPAIALALGAIHAGAACGVLWELARGAGIDVESAVEGGRATARDAQASVRPDQRPCHGAPAEPSRPDTSSMRSGWGRTGAS